MKIRFLIPFLLFGTITFAQNSSQRLDSLFNSLYKYGQINGNVLVAENGTPIYQKSFGYSNFEAKTLHNEQSIFLLASISKTFTAVAILQLKERGKLNIDDPVIRYLKDFPYPYITIRNLLSHTSGLPGYEVFENEIQKSPYKIFTNKDVIPSLTEWKKPLRFKPFEKWEYSNVNFNLLSLIVESVSGIRFQEYVQTNILTPAQMKSTYFNMDSVRLRGKNKSINHTYPLMYSSQLQNVDNLERFNWDKYSLSGMIGQGNLLSTTEDMLQYDKALYSGILLNASTLDEAFTPIKLLSGDPVYADNGIGKSSYGLGWFIIDDTINGKIVWHGGSMPGTQSIFLRNIDKKQTVILLDNASSTGLYKNGMNAMNILNNKPIIATKQSLVRKYASTLVDNGIDAAFIKFHQLRDDTTHYILKDDDLLRLGDDLLSAKAIKGNENGELALEVFRLNTFVYPNSASSYSWYAYALAKVGKKEEAIWMYNKCLKIKPDDDETKSELEELLKNK
jgi:CubicO group peptidase (beta-lactamase class C family)